MSLARRMQQAAAGSAGAGPAPSGWTDPDLANASYDSVSFSVSSQESSPYDVYFRPDGTKFYVIGFNSDRVHQYGMSTAWDLSTASYDSKSTSVSATGSFPLGLTMKPDGTKMYVVSFVGNSVFQYTLSTAWDISTALYDSVRYSVSAQGSASYTVRFNNDGTAMYVGLHTNDTIFQYSLSTAWNVSTASYSGKSLAVGSQDGDLRGVIFNPSGDELYLLGTGSDSVYKYSLSTAFDLSTASYDSVSFSVSSQDSDPTGLFFSSGGTKMYILGQSSDTIYQYSTA